MNIKLQFVPRLLDRARQGAEPKPERVDGIHLQEQFTRLIRAGSEIPAAQVLSERQHLACNESCAATSSFIP